MSHKARTTKPDFKLFPKPRITYSMLNAFVNICQLQHHFHYVEKIRSASVSPNMLFGSAADLVFKYFYERMKAGKTATKKKLVSIFDKEWGKQLRRSDNVTFDAKKTEEHWRNRGYAVINLLIKEAPRVDVMHVDLGFVVPLRTSTGVEVTTDAGVGILDMVGKDEGRIQIHDFKTTEKSKSRDQREWDIQGILYSYAIEQCYPQAKGKVDMIWDDYVLTKEPKIEQMVITFDHRHYDYVMALIASFEQHKRAGVMPMPRREINNWACKGCGYRAQCDDWAKTMGIPMLEQHAKLVEEED